MINSTGWMGARRSGGRRRIGRAPREGADAGRALSCPCSTRSICAAAGHDVTCLSSIRRGGSRADAGRGSAPPARSAPSLATTSPARHRSAVEGAWRSGTWRGAGGEMAAGSKRGESGRTGKGGERREKGEREITLKLTNFSHPPNRV
jgi:hypothetical protein